MGGGQTAALSWDQPGAAPSHPAGSLSNQLGMWVAGAAKIHRPVHTRSALEIKQTG